MARTPSFRQTTRSFLVCVVVLFGCSACDARYAVRVGEPTAILQTHMDNDSQHALNSNYGTELSPDLSCGGFVRLQSKPFAGRSHTSTPYPIRAGQSLLVSMNYGEGRAWGEIRGCMVTAEFVPKVDRRYRIDLHLRNEAQQCSINLVDTTDGSDTPVPFSLPSYACMGSVVFSTNPHVQIAHVTAEIIP